MTSGIPTASSTVEACSLGEPVQKLYSETRMTPSLVFASGVVDSD